VEAGVDGLMLSNHGGRQLDYAPSPVEILQINLILLLGLREIQYFT